MQVAAIEFARNVCGLEDANSREFNSSGKNCVIDLMEEQMAVLRKGGTMRLGAYPCAVRKDTKLFEAYGSENISERHRHRFEFNNSYRELMTSNGLTISGTSPNDEVVEAIEVSTNKFHVGVQFHPEFKSRPNKPHPLFVAFIKASLK
ncbi:CTP synthase (UTP-ammonia lyase) [Butyrivibrio fibrisolvens 16/4]|nr:CTP synthase (UTP-ammonia lyase) [Butyrivibrio fibrisolvens 16/4]